MMNLTDLRRGCMVGLIAGVGYLLAAKIISLIFVNAPYAKQVESWSYLLAIPIPALLLNYFSKFVNKQKEEEEAEKEAELDDDDDVEDIEDSDSDDTEDSEESETEQTN